MAASRYVVIGDTVNAASELERLTPSLQVDIAVSDELVARIRHERSAGALLDPVVPRGNVRVTGRRQPIWIWSADRRTANAPL